LEASFLRKKIVRRKKLLEKFLKKNYNISLSVLFIRRKTCHPFLGRRLQNFVNPKLRYSRYLAIPPDVSWRENKYLREVA
jgi:hypothetical protein